MWMNIINDAMQYIEENITKDLSVDEVALSTHVSKYHFQRSFTMLTGLTIGEYIRNRRLSLAAQELVQSNSKTIDVALKYGYTTPEAFCKAFERFHGISPSNAKKSGAPLKYFESLRVKVILSGGDLLNYFVEEKEIIKLSLTPFKLEGYHASSDIFNLWSDYYKVNYQDNINHLYGIRQIDERGSRVLSQRH